MRLSITVSEPVSLRLSLSCLETGLSAGLSLFQRLRSGATEKVLSNRSLIEPLLIEEVKCLCYILSKQ